MPVNHWAQHLGQKAKSPEEIATERAVRAAIADNDLVESQLLKKLPPEVITLEEAEARDERKLSRLISDDFPFDESQLAAVTGMTQSYYACMTGAAGTGKTTTVKKLVDSLMDLVPLDYINMKEYWKKGDPGQTDGDDYVIPDAYIPAVLNCAFTGRATQMIKRNFPRDWHGNIMTIHRALGFVPEFYDVVDEDQGRMVKKMRFVPTYGADLKMPWDIIIIDEAGMLGLELWHQLLAAIKPGCRIYMIGDINQLPPVHGRSIFGFALARWPAFELTHVHRQAGKDNPIVDNAWRVLKGEMPLSAGKFQMIKMEGDAQKASRWVRAVMPKMRDKGVYDPIRDTIITPINGNDGSRGYALGQLPLNREFAIMFNPSSVNPRYIIDGGRERKQLAIGDKVMATKNDYEAGITNGMTGLITKIEPHPGYGGDPKMYGLVADVNAYYEESGVSDEEDFSLSDLGNTMVAQAEAKENAKESRDRGPSSHIVTVEFGSGEHAFSIPFATLSEVGSLMTAYVVTCHKMQGGESPVIVIILHDAHKAMLYREWLYTAITRASQMCVLLYSESALRTAINKQNIKGSTLAQKIESFNLLNSDQGFGKALKVNLPEPEVFEHKELKGEGEDADVTSLIRNEPNGERRPETLTEPEPETPSETLPAQPPVAPANRLATLLKLKQALPLPVAPPTKAAPKVTIHLHLYGEQPAAPGEPIDLGTLRSESVEPVDAEFQPADTRQLEKVQQHAVQYESSQTNLLALAKPKPDLEVLEEYRRTHQRLQQFWKDNYAWTSEYESGPNPVTDLWQPSAGDSDHVAAPKALNKAATFLFGVKKS